MCAGVHVRTCVQAETQAAQGLQANLAQLKSLLGL